MVRGLVEERLERLYGQLSETKRVVIDVYVRSFIAALVLESLTIRSNEWEVKTKLDPNQARASEEIATQVEKAVRSVTEEAPTFKSPDGTVHIPLIGVVEQIHRRWCGIFPFCR
jgi:hypothetical protein